MACIIGVVNYIKSFRVISVDRNKQISMALAYSQNKSDSIFSQQFCKIARQHPLSVSLSHSDLVTELSHHPIAR